MSKSLGDEARKTIEKRKRAAAKRSAEIRAEEERQLNLERDALVAELIPTLPDRVRDAAKKGTESIPVFEKQGYELSRVEKRAMYEIDNWAKTNDLHTHYSHSDGGSEWFATDFYHLCWADHRNDRVW